MVQTGLGVGLFMSNILVCRKRLLGNIDGEFAWKRISENIFNGISIGYNQGKIDGNCTTDYSRFIVNTNTHPLLSATFIANTTGQHLWARPQINLLSNISTEYNLELKFDYEYNGADCVYFGFSNSVYGGETQTSDVITKSKGTIDNVINVSNLNTIKTIYFYISPHDIVKGESLTVSNFEIYKVKKVRK